MPRDNERPSWAGNINGEDVVPTMEQRDDKAASNLFGNEYSDAEAYLSKWLRSTSLDDDITRNTLMTIILQHMFDKETRDYNSVQSQVERLMAAGMSRAQALLTATAGEAPQTQVANVGEAEYQQQQTDLQHDQFKIQRMSTAFDMVSSMAQFCVGNYGALKDMIGDSLVMNVGKEIYSWLPRGIQVPSEARLSAENFKRWCLGILEDKDGNIIESPKEAKDLISSDNWARMASRPSGWLAFEKYFNANFSTRGYKEDVEDAMKMRELQSLEVVAARMQNYLNMPQLYDATLDIAMADLQGITISLGTNGIIGSVGGDVGFFGVSYDDNGSLIFSDDSTPTKTKAQGYFFNEDGTIRSDAPQQLRLLYSTLAHDTFIASSMTNPKYLSQVSANIFNNEELKGIMLEADKIIQEYRKTQLQKASLPSSTNNAFIDMLQNLLTNYMLMTGGRSFIDDAGSAVGFGTDAYFRNKRFGHHIVE